MIPTRLTLGLTFFAALIFLLMIRVNFSIAILAMVQPLPSENGTIVPLPDYGPRYEWDAYEQSLLLGAFFIGFSIMSMPMGMLIDRYGHAKWHMLAICGSCTVLTALSPLAAKTFESMLTLRLIMGLSSGALTPAVQKLISCWSPPNEKAKFMTVLFGIDMGNVITWTMCGYLIESIGWSYAFYVPAIILAVFSLVWWRLVYDSPADHPRIDPAEREYIESSLMGIDRDQKAWPPIWSILTSMPFYALLLLQYGHIWGLFFLMTASPKFMNEVLGYNLGASGFLASLPYIVRLLTGFGFGALCDHMKSIEWISQLWVRKLGCLLSHIIPGLFLIGIPLVSQWPAWCVAFMTISFAFNGAVVMTSLQNMHELAPNYTSTIYAMIATFSLSTGFTSPLVVAAFTRERNTIDEWINIFRVGAAVYIVPAIVFMVFGSVRIQAWNSPLVERETSSMGLYSVKKDSLSNVMVTTTEKKPN